MHHLRTLAAALALSAAVLAPASARADTTGATAPAATDVTVSAVPARVTVGDDVTVTGRAGGPSRPVTVQVQTPTGWMRVASGTSDTEGRYRLPAPTGWYGQHTFRVAAPAVSGFEAGFSVTRAVTVSPGYTPAGSASAHRFMGPAGRWNPCRRIAWRLNTAGAPDGARTDLARAFADIHAATGLRFSYAGTSTKVPWSRDGAASQFEDGTIVIAWTTPKAVPELGGSTVGLGGARSTSDGRTTVYVAGGVALDRTGWQAPRGFGDLQSRGALLLHELGHVVGLDHTDGRDQVMYPSLTPGGHARYGAGDLAGLAALGADQGCL